MVARLDAALERLRSSLFFVPMAFVLLGGGLGIAMVQLDEQLQDSATRLPFVLTSTVGSAREVLGIIASATITVAGIAFSVSLLVIQQASSQYSPRVVDTLFRDAFNRRVMGVALGTFTYCLMVLRTVRTALDDRGEPVIPNLSVGVSVLLGVGSILAIVAFIDHNAHAMEVSNILGRVSDHTITQISQNWPDDGEGVPARPEAVVPDAPGHTVALRRNGWIQQISSEQLLELVPDGGIVRLDTAVGRYAVTGTPLCTIWPSPHDPDATDQRADEAVTIGSVRTPHRDPSYGIRQLADVALVALSPGVNDPTTAQDAIFHLTGVLREALVRGVPPKVERDDRDRTVIRAEDHTEETLVDLAFDEVRRTAAPLPTVSVYLLEALHLLNGALISAGHPERTAPIVRQARLVLDGAQRADVLEADRAQVGDAFDRRFGGVDRRPEA